MGSEGIKLTQTGHDVKTAGDADLIFSSSWPNLKIVFQGKFEFSASKSPLTLLKHNLGYVPAFIAYTINADGTYEIFREIVSADTKNIYWAAGGGAQIPFRVAVALIVFELDIEKNFKSPQVNLGNSSTSSTSRDIGIKLTKETKDTSSNDLRDYLIHSATRAPMVHSVTNQLAVEPGEGFGFKDSTLILDLPYNPIFFGYVQNVGGFITGEYTLVNNFAGIVATDKIIRFTLVPQGSKISLVVLKDPFNIDDSTTAV